MECKQCGISTASVIDCAQQGWRVVLGRLLCHLCASRFPRWMHQSI